MASDDSPPPLAPWDDRPLAGVPLGWDAAPGDLPRAFRNRAGLAAFLAGLRPGAAAPVHLSPIRGGRRRAEALLAAIDPRRYGASRNHLDGAVTRLSPYLRHGVLTLPEARDAVLRRSPTRADGEKLMSELGWRDYWQRLWRRWGDAIWLDREPLGTGLPGGAYTATLPADVLAGRTGLACIDGFQEELVATGWLHNHARMWLASYLVHWRRVRWQAGARWFLQHLLDGDPASNNLSWQWVAGSFSSRPYIFNRANLERFGGGRFCRRCAAAAVGDAAVAGGCPFQADYDDLRQRLFVLPDAAPPRPHAAAVQPQPQRGEREIGSPRHPVLWIHGEALGPAHPTWRLHPGRPAVFCFDARILAGETATTRAPGDPATPLDGKRLGFLYECLLETPVSIRCGDVVAEVLAFARRHGADTIVTSRAVDPRFGILAAGIAARLPLLVLEPEPFVALPDTAEQPLDLRRFRHYWRRAEPLLWSRA